MARSAATKVYANFSQGLITEGNALSHPENSASDIVNIDLIENGSVARRPGLSFDASTTVAFPAGGVPLAGMATNVFKWKAVNGNPSLNIGVVQTGDVLAFYYLKDDLVSSASLAAPKIILSAPSRTTASNSVLRKSTNIQVSSGGGRLYVAGKYIDPFVLEFNEPTVEFDEGTTTKTDLVLKIRDFEVFKEGETLEGYSVAGESRQNFMSGAHFYNLANQGWPSDADAAFVVEDKVSEATAYVSDDSDPDVGVTQTEPAEYTFTKNGYFPTTADSFHAYQAGGGSTVNRQIAYSPWALRNDYEGSSPAPRGRFIKEAFYISRYGQGVTGGAVLTVPLQAIHTVQEVVTAQTRPEAISFYAGRIWYAGLQGGQFTNNVYFSQVIGDDLRKAPKCYQDADPTAEVLNELVATDGGIFNLEEVGKIYRMEPIGSGLAVVADNGVWVISGEGEFSSFSATNFSIRKVTDQGAINSESIVFAKDSMYYWGETALYALQQDASGVLTANDISSATIKSFFQVSNAFAKQSSFSVFDEGANRILWFYSDTENPDFSEFPNKAFNKVLYFDLSLGAFGKYSLGTTSEIMPVSAINSSILAQIMTVDPITDGGVTVTVSGEDLVHTTTTFVPDRSSIKVMTVTNGDISGWSYRFSDFTDVVNFEDWGTDTPAFMETGFDSLGDILSKAKKAPFLGVNFTRTETGFELDGTGEELVLKNQSGCLVSYTWDWGDLPSAQQFQAYKLLKNYTPSGVLDTFDYDGDVISTRNRLRGRGTSLGLRFESEPGKDMKLLGYGILFSNRGRI